MASIAKGYGWDGSAWRKLPLMWGYSDRLAEYKTTEDAAAGTNYLTFTAVPAGEVHVIQHIDAYNSSSVCTYIQAQANTGTVMVRLKHAVSPGAGVPVIWTGSHVMKEGDTARVRFNGCTLNDDLHARVWGYKMKVAE